MHMYVHTFMYRIRVSFSTPYNERIPLKEKDYATNFGNKKNLDAKFAEWQASGLGDAFRAALAEPDVVSLTPWTPYGPSAGALASFLATGVRSEDGAMIGVFSTQLPPNAMSIDNVEPVCTLEAITESFEGSINFVGLGQPVADEIDNQVPCFKGKTAKAFLELLTEFLTEGYPLGNEESKVADPFRAVMAHSGGWRVRVCLYCAGSDESRFQLV